MRESSVEQIGNSRQFGESDDVEAQVHDLDERKQAAHILGMNTGDFMRGRENGVEGRTVLNARGRNRLRLRCECRYDRRLWLGGQFRSLRFRLYRSEKTVSPPCQGLDKSRIGGRIAQRLTDLVHQRVEAVVEVHEGVRRPETLPQFFA